jgi:hypothetical protein
MTKLKNLFGEGLVMYFEEDGRFIPIQMRITKDRKPIIVISVVKEWGEELAGKSLHAVKELSKNLHNDSTHSIIRESKRVILYLR